MNIEDILIEVEKFKEGFDETKYEKLEEKTNDTTKYLSSHNENILELLNKALVNALKLDEVIWNKIQSVYYYDFFQVRHKDTNQLEYTYTLNRNRGLSKRGYCMKSDWKLDTTEFKEFINNDDAVKKLTEISGYGELINTIRNILNTLTIIPDRRDTNYAIKIDISPTEKTLLKLTEKENNISYNFSTKELAINGDTYEYGSWDTEEINYLTRCALLTQHEQHIFKEGNKHLSILLKQKKIYNIQLDEIKGKLSKWLMLEMI